MNITIKQIRAFIAVAQAQSFAEACELVHLSQPALSIAIKNLEQIVGGQLLIRSTRTLALTPEGGEFLPVAKRLLAEWDGALNDLHNLFSLKRGNLAIATMPSFASTDLPMHIQAFRDEFPNINIKIHDVINEETVSMVREGKVEFAISFDPGISDDLTFEPLFCDEFICALSAQHKLAQYKKLEWKKLAEFPFIALQKPSSIRELIDNTLKEQQLTLNIEFETNQLATIAQMIATNLGVSALPSLYRPQMEALGLSCIKLTQPTISRRVGIVTRRRYPLSQSALSFVNIIRAHYLHG